MQEAKNCNRATVRKSNLNSQIKTARHGKYILNRNCAEITAIITIIIIYCWNRLIQCVDFPLVSGCPAWNLDRDNYCHDITRGLFQFFQEQSITVSQIRNFLHLQNNFHLAILQ